MRPLMIELFSGTARLAQCFGDLGWETLTVDVNPDLAPDVVADIVGWKYAGRRPDFVHAAPVCTQYTRQRLPWFNDEPEPDHSQLLAVKAFLDRHEPEMWGVECTDGAVPFFGPILGPHRSFHCIRLWGALPAFDVAVRPWKERCSSVNKVARAAYPWPFCRAYAEAVDQFRRLFAPSR